MNFEDLLQDYSINLVNHSQFLLNALIAALLSWSLGLFYKKHGKSVGNRSNFSNNFMLLALTTMLIIYIVKSSIALSLGLVGALSIVRFRAAIKEPEELVYLFLVIAIGLGMGANQTGITVMAYVLIMALLLIKAKVSQKTPYGSKNQMHVNISTDEISESEINSILSASFKTIELRRMSQKDKKLFMTYIIESENFDQLAKAKDNLLAQAPKLEFSFIDNSNLAG